MKVKVDNLLTKLNEHSLCPSDLELKDYYNIFQCANNVCCIKCRELSIKEAKIIKI